MGAEQSCKILGEIQQYRYESKEEEYYAVTA